MRIKKYGYLVFKGFFVFALMTVSVWAQEKEDLLFEDIPVVITASRKEQPITESPSAITVIDAEDIRQSGAVNIPDVLRMVAGVDVMTITLRDQQVGVRGLNSNQSNKLLVMLDGRPVYIDLYGSVFWDLFPVGLEDIQRIEVVKSPVSSIYGANAFSGVVNIITKTPEQAEGTRLKITAGEAGTVIGSMTHAGSGKKMSYKVSGEWNRAKEWQGDENAGEIYKVNALLNYDIGKKSKLALSLGRTHTRDRKLFVDFDLGNSTLTGDMDYIRLDYEYGDFRFRTFFNRLNAEFFAGEAGLESGYTSTLDIEVLHSFKIGKSHSVVWGANYRHNRIKKFELFFNRGYKQDLWALFFEDEITLSPRLRVTVGGRYDRHPLVGDHVSPRGSLFFSPSPKHIIRFSIAQAYRNPAFFNSYFNFTYQTFFQLPAPFPAVEVPFTYISRGNESMGSEGVIAYEIGYQSRWPGGVNLGVNLFYNMYTDFFTSTDRYTYYAEHELFPGSPGNVILKSAETDYGNGGDARGIGGEIHLDVKFSEAVSGFINYSFQEITDTEDNPNTTLVDETDRVRPQYPKHKVNGGLRIKFKNGLSFNCLVHWAAKTSHYISYADGSEYMVDLDDYLLVNTRIGYRLLNKKLEIALAVFNLFNHKHFEYPPGIATMPFYAHEIGRRISLSIGYTF